MNIRNHKKKFSSIEALFQHFFTENGYQSSDQLLFLIVLVDFFRPKNPKEKTAISIELSAQKGILELKITNQIHQNKDAVTASGGIGLANTKRRLDLLYPGQHSLIINEDLEKKMYQVDLKIKL